MGFEPTTFCMASRKQDVGSSTSREKPAKHGFLGRPGSAMVSSFHREIKRVSGLKPDWGLCRQTRAGEGHPHGTPPIDEAGAFETLRDHSRAATRDPDWRFRRYGQTRTVAR
jgi:hypothetical protein